MGRMPQLKRRMPRVEASVAIIHLQRGAERNWVDYLLPNGRNAVAAAGPRGRQHPSPVTDPAIATDSPATGRHRKQPQSAPWKRNQEKGRERNAIGTVKPQRKA